MSVLLELASVSLKGLCEAGTEKGLGLAGRVAVLAADALRQRFTDHSLGLTRAMQRASDRAWRTAELALAGSSWWDRLKLTLATADERALREQIQAFLGAHPLDGVDGHGPDFRGQCVAQLQAARRAGVLSSERIDPSELASRVGDLSRFGDPIALVDAEFVRLGAVATMLRKHGYTALAAFVELRPANGPPLLLAAMRYFFHRELTKDEALFRGLAYARLDGLAEGQRSGFADIEQALDKHGEKLETLLTDVFAVVSQTRGDVLDIKAELARQGQQMQQLGDAVLEALRQRQLEKRSLDGGDSLSVRDEGERRLVKELIARYRRLPEEQRKEMPALLNAVGKLEVVTGDFESAQADFREVARIAEDPRARAEAAYNLYTAALERRAWHEALPALRDSMVLDAGRFSPFPGGKFEPERILGAGGFGVAFLCRNRHSGAKVVVKTLRRDGLDRELTEVFREAQALEALEHPAIIRVRDCDFADAGGTKPFLVMDYFDGENLADYVTRHGAIPSRELVALGRLVAEGLQRAHAQKILHRDVKPANLLVRRTAGGAGAPRWEAKLIDFGLAMRTEAGSSTLKASFGRTLIGNSIAGTLDYAAPEQMGKVNAPVGTYSDVYGFARTCCFALFGTPQPTFQHWKQIPHDFADLIGRCLAEQPKDRPQDFTAVIAELDKLSKKFANTSVPEVLEAEPVVEKVRAAEPVREKPPVAPRAEPSPRKATQAKPTPAQAVAPVRLTESVPKPSRKSSWPLVTFLLLFVVAAVGASVFLLMKKTDIPSPKPYGGSPALPPSPPGDWQPPRYAAISAKEFPTIVANLRKSPTNKYLTEIAARLGETDPTREQNTKHETFKLRQEMFEKKVCSEKALKEIQQEDEILAVSLALKPLTKSGDPEAQRNVVKALQKWGTEENLAGLIDLTEVEGPGAEVVRIGACKALGRIPDQRGAYALADRLEKGSTAELKAATEALVTYPTPQMAERALTSLLKARKPSQPAKLAAVAILKEIGGEDSLRCLNEMKGESWSNKAVNEALTAIAKRKPQKK